MHDVAEADPVGEYDTPFSPQYDELHTASGEIREHWSELAGVLEGRSPAVLERYRRRVRTLVDNHGITYNPVDSVGPDGEPTGPVRWEVDALPLVLAADDWAVLERGLVQRSRVLDALLADLDRIRERGYSVDEQEQELGVRCFAMAVPNAPTPSAVSVSGPVSRVDEAFADRAVPLLREAVENISAELNR